MLQPLFHCGVMLSCCSLLIVCFLKHISLIKSSKTKGMANSLYCSYILLALYNVNVHALCLICNFRFYFSFYVRILSGWPDYCVGFQVVFGMFEILFPNQTPIKVMLSDTLVAIILLPSVSVPKSQLNLHVQSSIRFIKLMLYLLLLNLFRSQL